MTAVLSVNITGDVYVEQLRLSLITENTGHDVWTIEGWIHLINPFY